MAETNLQRFHRWFEEVWNQRREDTIDELSSPESLGYGFGPEPVRGSDAFRAVKANFLAAIGDMHVTVDDAIESGDTVAGRLTVRGRHVGDTLGFPATNKEVRILAMVYSTWKDGRIVEAWNLVDFSPLMGG